MFRPILRLTFRPTFRSMSFSDFSKPVIYQLSCRLTTFCQRRGLKPLAILNGVTLWLGWAGLTWLAFLVSLLFIEIGEKNDVSVLDGLLGGFIVGLAQWQVLRVHLSGVRCWIMVSTLSWGGLALFPIGAVGWITPSTSDLVSRMLQGAFYGGYVGLVLGLAQWWMIRRQVALAWRWVPLNSGIWSVAIACGWLFGGELRAVSGLFVSDVIGLVVAWGAIAALSGLGIVSLLYPSLDSNL